MAMAVERDAIARESARDSRTTFELGAPALRAALADRLPWRDAVVEAYLTLLVAAPDTHIARKLGLPAAITVQRRGSTSRPTTAGRPARWEGAGRLPAHASAGAASPARRRVPSG